MNDNSTTEDSSRASWKLSQFWRATSEIIDFCRQYANGPKQGTREWFNFRQKSVGGSEIANLFGEGYKSVENKNITAAEEFSAFVSKKLNPPACQQFKIECAWGNLFQDIAADVFCARFNTEIIGDIITVPAEFAGAHYSPDGFCVAGFSDEGELVPSYLAPDENLTKCLVEIKCPYRRYNFRSIPKYYLPQMWDGLFILRKQIQKCLFISNNIRACPMDRFFCDDPYCEGNFDIDRVPRAQMRPVAMGIIAFYRADSDNNEGLDTDTIFAIEPVDLGDAGLETRVEAIHQWFDKRYTIEHSPLIITSAPDETSESDPQRLLDYVSEGAVSFLPWKLMEQDIKIVGPNPDFEREIQEKVAQFCAAIQRSV